MSDYCVRFLNYLTLGVYRLWCRFGGSCFFRLSFGKRTSLLIIISTP